MSRIVILGGGTAGTIIANRLRKRFADDVRAGRTSITVVDQDDRHLYQPGLLFVPFGMYDADDIVRSRTRQLHEGVTFRQASVARIDTDDRLVLLEGEGPLPYDVLVIASGTRIAPEETEGLTGPGWREKVFDFYSLEGAAALAKTLNTWPGGRLVVNIVEMPIKCPVAPLEFAFLADWFFTERGIRDKVSITFVTPLDGAFTKPEATRVLGHLLADKRIELVTEFNTGRVDGENGVLASWDDREVPFDLLVATPLHQGATFVRDTPRLGDDNAFVMTDPRTLQSLHFPEIFALGDATNVPTSKAGSVAHFEAEVLEGNIARYLAHEPLVPDFDGHANCFIETGFDKALLIDFNYDTEPLPGTFPFAAVGPLTLLGETRLNHFGKLAFKWVYWNLLLPGHDIPTVGAQMSMSGKHATATTTGASHD
jgi:sulfide:quinone oxidoreductase